jgi:hypothetical protein
MKSHFIYFVWMSCLYFFVWCTYDRLKRKLMQIRLYIQTILKNIRMRNSAISVSRENGQPQLAGKKILK